MYYLQSRYYNPEWGRFINADTYGGKVGDLSSLNSFAYCENNPINRHDPSGYVWGFIREFISQVGNAIKTLKPAHAFAGGVSMLESPLPGPADLVAIAITGVVTFGAIAVGGWRTYKSYTKTKVKPTTKARIKTVSIPITQSKKQRQVIERQTIIK